MRAGVGPRSKHGRRARANWRRQASPRSARGDRGVTSRRRCASVPATAHVYLWCMFAGLAKFQLGREEEAVVWLRRSIDANRNYPSSHFILAAALAHLGRLPEARSEAQAGLAMNPTFTIARFRSGVSSDDPVVVAGFGALRRRPAQGRGAGGMTAARPLTSRRRTPSLSTCRAPAPCRRGRASWLRSR